MTPVRIFSAIGLLALGAGCSTLQQGPATHSLTQRGAPPPVKVADAPVDIFKVEAESPATRIARYFPSLPPKADPAAAPTSTSTEGWFRRGVRSEEHLKAIPRPGSRADDETATALAPKSRAGRPTTQKRPILATPPTNRQRDDHLSHATPTDADSTPVLPVAVVAESDPQESRVTAPVRVLPPLTSDEQELRAARVAQSGIGSTRSIRRMPPVPRTNSSPIEPRRLEATNLAPEIVEQKPSKPEPAVAQEKLPKVEPDEDREMRLVKARADETPDPTKATPPAEETFMPDSDGSLEPPQSAVEAKLAEEPTPPDEPTAAKTPKAEADLPPAAEVPETKRSPKRDTRPLANRPMDVNNTDSLRDAVQANRPRMERFAPIRSDRVADLPPPLFLNAYYDDEPAPTRRPVQVPKRDPETKAARWTWTPKILRRLRGEDLAPPKANVVVKDELR